MAQIARFDSKTKVEIFLRVVGEKFPDSKIRSIPLDENGNEFYIVTTSRPPSKSLITYSSGVADALNEGTGE